MQTKRINPKRGINPFGGGGIIRGKKAGQKKSGAGSQRAGFARKGGRLLKSERGRGRASIFCGFWTWLIKGGEDRTS